MSFDVITYDLTRPDGYGGPDRQHDVAPGWRTTGPRAAVVPSHSAARSHSVVPSHSAARWQAGLGLAGPYAAALLLPSPAGQIALLTDSRPDVVVGAIAVLVAIAVTWSLAAWSVTVCGVALLARVPGTTGAMARRILGGITPTVIRRVVMTAAGLSVAAGLAACGTSAAAGAPALPASAMSASIAAPATPADLPPAVPALPEVDLDWPITMTNAPPVAESSTRVETSTPSIETADRSAAPDEDPTPSTMTPPPAETTPPAPIVDTGAGASTGADAQSESQPGSQFESQFESQPTSKTESQTESPLTSQFESRPSDGPALRDSESAPSGVVVQPGDSLWSIAARGLPADATAARIDAAWREWYRSNHDVIGDDPNLIRPGQYLTAPADSISAPASPHPDASAHPDKEAAR